MIVEFKKKHLKKRPFSLLHGPKYIAPLLCVMIVCSFLFLDKPLALFFHRSINTLNNPFIVFNNLFSPIFALLVLPAAFFVFRFPMRQEKRARKLWLFSLSTAVSLFASAVITVILGRANPEWFFIHKEIPFRLFEWDSSFHSFPSMTACNIGAIAAAWSCLAPKWSIRILAFGLFVSFLPVVTTECFLSDALAGVGIGMYISSWIYTLMRKEMAL